MAGRKSRDITVNISYPGNVISVNHYLGRRPDGGQYIKPEAEAWMQMLGWLIKSDHVEDWRLPIKVVVSGTFRDKRSCPDLHNLLKCICDGIEDVTGLNDKQYKTETTESQINPAKEPELTITIRESELG